MATQFDIGTPKAVARTGRADPRVMARRLNLSDTAVHMWRYREHVPLGRVDDPGLERRCGCEYLYCSACAGRV